jgi:beta-phosphoglucomutase-like phosphatase (HAD superfamily)
MTNIKLILLDFDGTLADTRQANGEAYMVALAEVGINMTMQDYTSRYFGMRCMEFMNEVGISDPSVMKSIRQRKVEIYPSYFHSVRLNTPLWEWCMMMQKMGAKVWIVSTGHIDNITNVMRYLNIESQVDGIITGDDVSNAKPHPECFLKAMEIAGVTPRETIIFEDSPMGLEAAERSGAAFVKITM